MGKALFITGTGTDVGKTYVTGLIVKCLRDAGLSASYYKAALSGAETAEDGSLLPGDALYVRRIAGLMEPADELVSYVYRDAVLPKAALQGKTFNLIAALCVRYPQGKQVRLDFEVCSPRSTFARRL